MKTAIFFDEIKQIKVRARETIVVSSLARIYAKPHTYIRVASHVLYAKPYTYIRIASHVLYAKPYTYIRIASHVLYA